jgi:hypothetical protein
VRILYRRGGTGMHTPAAVERIIEARSEQVVSSFERHPSGAKAHWFCGFYGTAKAVPFQN